MQPYTGFRTLSVPSQVIDELYQHNHTIIDEALLMGDQLGENEYIILQSFDRTNHSAIARVRGNTLIVFSPVSAVNGVTPRNREQSMALDALTDPSIRVVILTGRAGSGKTLLALAAALWAIENQDTEQDKLVLTKPMTEVGRNRLGILPGSVEEKFEPYLQNYMCNLSHMVGSRAVGNLIEQYDMQFLPLQLILGVSWANSFIVADEVQTLDPKEMVALGTRVGEGSKLVLMGDLNQRHERIAIEKTGLAKIIDSDTMKQSPLVASIELQNCERGPVAALFADVFGV